jgi:TetR/AcrR family transcriptional regulator, transcriptional repressor for nem operon
VHGAPADALDTLKTTGHIDPMPKPNLRERILSAGFETLYVKGFNAASVQDIAEAAGAPKGSFYNHFDSKEALGVAVVDEYIARTSSLLPILADPALPPLSRLRNYFEALNELSAGGAQRGCLLGNFGSELSNQSAPIRRRVSAAFDSWGGAIADVVAEAQRDGAIGSELSAKSLAAFIVDAWEGAVLRTKVEGDRAAIAVFFSVIFSKVLK